MLKHFPGLFGSVKVIDSPDRLFSVWSGASVVASLSSFRTSVVPRAVYEEHGPSILRNYQGKATEDDDDASLPAPQ